MILGTPIVGDSSRRKAFAELNAANPQVASRMASIFNDGRRYDEDRQGLMRVELDRIASSAALSKDVYEIVSRALSR